MVDKKKKEKKDKKVRLKSVYYFPKYGVVARDEKSAKRKVKSNKLIKK